MPMSPALNRRRGIFGAAAAPDPVVPGNLPTGITQRVRNPDGSISTVRTMSFGSDGGEVLVPTVINGRVVSDQEAMDHYDKTGENFGTFRTPEDATSYAESLHNRHAAGLAVANGSDRLAANMRRTPPAPQKPGFDWSKLLGVLGDSLSIAGGGQATFVPGLLEQRQRQQAQAYAAQQQEQQRQQGLQDWVWKQQFEAEHPKPINNDTVADYQFIVQNLGEAAGKEFLRNKANPPQYRQGPDGQFYRIDTSPTGAPPTFTAQDWDNAAPVQGGQSATPTGGFR